MGADAERGRTVTLGLRTTGFVIAVASVLSLSSASALPVPDAATSRYTADGSNLGPRAGYGDKPRWGDVDWRCRAADPRTGAGRIRLLRRNRRPRRRTLGR